MMFNVTKIEHLSVVYKFRNHLSVLEKGFRANRTSSRLQGSALYNDSSLVQQNITRIAFIVTFSVNSWHETSSQSRLISLVRPHITPHFGRFGYLISLSARLRDNDVFYLGRMIAKHSAIRIHVPPHARSGIQIFCESKK